MSAMDYVQVRRMAAKIEECMAATSHPFAEPSREGSAAVAQAMIDAQLKSLMERKVLFDYKLPKPFVPIRWLPEYVRKRGYKVRYVNESDDIRLGDERPRSMRRWKQYVKRHARGFIFFDPFVQLAQPLQVIRFNCVLNRDSTATLTQVDDYGQQVGSESVAGG